MKPFSKIAVGAVLIFVCGMLTGLYVIQDASQSPLITTASDQADHQTCIVLDLDINNL